MAGRKASLLIILILAATGLAFGRVSYFYWPTSRILPGVILAPVGRELAGLTREGLDELLADLPRKVLLQLEDQAWEAAPEDFGFQIDGDLTWQRASLAGRGKVAAALLGKSATILEPVVAFDEEALDAWLQSLAGEVYRRPQNPSLGPAGELIPGEEGRRLDLAEAKSSILAAWLGRGPGTLALPLEKLAPQTTTADLEPFRGGCKLASFRTSLGPSDPNRVHNIALAAGAVSGVILPPGGRFSFNEIVGPRIAELGFKEAPELIQSRLVPGIGGGICQVSSTLYNVVLLAGLPIIERHNHSRPPKYVGPGRDATVVYPGKDFAFRNDKDQALLLLARLDGGWLEVSLIGQEPLAEQVSLAVEILEEIPFNEEEIFDPALGPGQEEVVEEGSGGLRVRLWRTIHRADGSAAREIVDEDLYPPVPRLVRRGIP
jgi:vancomycin resistance protein YoaR